MKKNPIGSFAVPFDKEAGTFGEMKTVSDVAVSASTTVALFNGRLYATGSDGITVVNTETLEKIYSTGKYQISDKKSVVPANLTLSIGYATEENGNTVYLYGNSNTSPNHQFVLKDNETATEGTMTLLNSVTEAPNFSTSQIFVAPNGSLLFVNDSGYLYYLASKPGAVVYPVEEQITALGDQLTEENQEAFLAAETAYNELDELHKPLVKEELVTRLQTFRQAYEEKLKQEEEDKNNAEEDKKDEAEEENTPISPSLPNDNEKEENPNSGVPTPTTAIFFSLLAGGCALAFRKKKIRL